LTEENGKLHRDLQITRDSLAAKENDFVNKNVRSNGMIKYSGLFLYLKLLSISNFF